MNNKNVFQSNNLPQSIEGVPQGIEGIIVLVVVISFQTCFMEKISRTLKLKKAKADYIKLLLKTFRRIATCHIFLFIVQLFVTSVFSKQIASKSLIILRCRYFTIFVYVVLLQYKFIYQKLLPTASEYKTPVWVLFVISFISYYIAALVISEVSLFMFQYIFFPIIINSWNQGKAFQHFLSARNVL